MRKPADWKEFLTNDDNKQQFIDVLVRVWSADEFSPNLKGRKVLKYIIIIYYIQCFFIGYCDC